ncbi:hypothetical protein CYLTODRAFT_417057 [Cylindrobasidium torrendii FP15055 ss-10]|uniref:Apple domain-containing protein n=1 Tax=Cylindrobasidium torrendii FP15055 ss-10 TaxID=1314674 RepID=A0A0D7BUS5_9AGAR|nr:hypothetical protein CYLTODRAFT_417057 [Cylindrobasidium torrendii FP15055 ss-10]
MALPRYPQPRRPLRMLTVASKRRQTADVGYAYVDAGLVKYSSTIDAKDAAALSISQGSLLVDGEYYTFATAADVGTTLSALWSIANTVDTGDISTTFTLDGSLGWTNEAAFTGPATICVDASGETRNIYWKFSTAAELVCDEVTTELVIVHADGTVTLASDTTSSSTGATSTSASSSSSSVASTTTSSAAGATFTAAQIKISGSRNRKRQTSTSGYAFLDGDSVKFSSTIAATDAAPLVVDADGALVVGGTSYTYATATDISTTLSAPWSVIATLDSTLVSTTFSAAGGSLSWTNTDAFTGPVTLCMDASGDTRNLYWKFATTATQVCVDVTVTLVVVYPDGSVASIATSTSTSTTTSATPTPTAVAPGTPVLDGGYLQYKGVVYPITDASSSSSVPTTLASCAEWCSSADSCGVALFVSGVCYSLPSLPTTAATAAYSAADGYAVPASSLSTYKSFTIYPHIVPKVSYSSWTYFGNMGGTYSADFTGCMDMCYDSSSCVGAQVDANYCYIYNNADTTSLSYLAVSNFALRPRPVTPSAPVISGGFVQYGGLVYSTAGSSASSTTPTDLASCAQWCASTGSCAAAVYDGGVCYSLPSVPSGSPAPTSSSANGYAVATSTLPTYKTFTVYSNMILGSKSTQNENFPLTSLSSPYTQDFNGCMDYCLSRDWLPCVAVQLVSSRCYIYTSTNTADDLSVNNGAKLALLPAYVSASKPTISGGIYTQVGLVYPTDSAYALSSSAGSVDQCAQLCVADGGCTAVTYNAGVCYSFSALPTASAQKTAVATDGYAVKVSALTTESGFIEYPNASLDTVTGNIASAPSSSLTPPNTVTGCANWASQNSWQGVDSAVSGGTCYLFSGRTRDNLVAAIGSYALFKV